MGCVVYVTGMVDPFPGNHTLCLCHSQRHSSLLVDTYSHSCGALVLTLWEEMDGWCVCGALVLTLWEEMDGLIMCVGL